MRRSATASNRRRAEPTDNLVALFDIGPYDRNRVTRSQMQRLREQIDSNGAPATAKDMGVSQLTMYRVASGFAHQLRPNTAKKVREYFAPIRQ